MEWASGEEEQRRTRTSRCGEAVRPHLPISARPWLQCEPPRTDDSHCETQLPAWHFLLIGLPTTPFWSKGHFLAPVRDFSRLYFKGGARILNERQPQTRADSHIYISLTSSLANWITSVADILYMYQSTEVMMGKKRRNICFLQNCDAEPQQAGDNLTM